MDAADASARCWSCGAAPGDSPFCAACGAVQPPGPADHFARLGLPRGWEVDPDRLEKRYFALQRALHPDRFAGRSERERALSARQSAALNEAWSVLGDPLRRAEYLLALAGVAVNAETGAAPADPEVLAEAMADREAAMEAEDAAEGHGVDANQARGGRGRGSGTSAGRAAAHENERQAHTRERDDVHHRQARSSPHVSP